MANNCRRGYVDEFEKLTVCHDLTVGGKIFANNGIDLNEHRISNASNPVFDQDLATKRYVDRSNGGYDFKESVRVATVSNIVDFNSRIAIELSLDLVGGLPTVLEYNERVLVKNQFNLKENGIYVWITANRLVRSDDMNGDFTGEVSGGNLTYIEEGDSLINTGWIVMGKGLITIGVDDIVWTKVGGPGASATSLATLTDVSLGSVDPLTNNNVLMYDSSISKWINRNGAGGYIRLGVPDIGGYSSDVGIVSDMSIATAIQKLDDYISNITISDTTFSGLSLYQLSDVSINNPLDDTTLIYNSTSDIWYNKLQAGENIQIGLPQSDTYSGAVGIISSDSISTAVGKLDSFVNNINVNNSEIVLLPDNATTRVNIINTNLQGTYLLLVKSTSDNGSGGVFIGCKPQNAVAGIVNRLISAPSSTTEVVDSSWTANNKMQLFHSVVNPLGVGDLVSYTVTIISS